MLARDGPLKILFANDVMRYIEHRIIVKSETQQTTFILKGMLCVLIVRLLHIVDSTWFVSQPRITWSLENMAVLIKTSCALPHHKNSQIGILNRVQETERIPS